MKQDDIVRKVRTKFEEFIAHELKVRNDVAKGELAAGFIAKEPKLCAKLADYFTLEALKRWAEDILKRSVATRVAPLQMIFPLWLGDVMLPACFSFRSMTNQIRYVQAAKAEAWQIESHIKIQQENLDGAIRGLAETERVYKAARAVFEQFPGIRLGAALKKLAEEDAGAA